MKGGGKYDFDVLVIGAGSAGFAAAIAARESGAKVAIVERGRLGGECPNTACVPTKSLLYSVGKMSWSKAIARKDSIVQILTGSRLSNMLDQQGITHIKGSATFIDSHTIQVQKHEWSAAKFVIAGGTETSVPPIPGLREFGYLTYADVVSLKKLPKSIVILGGGPVGVEFAEILNGFGVATTIIQHASRLLEREEPEVSSVAEESFRAKGIQVHTGADVVEIKKGRVFVIRQGKMEFHMNAEHILVASGKISLAEAMGVEQAGIARNERGFIKTDKFLRTSVPHIFAAGDVKAGPQFTHVASYDGDIAGWNTVHPKSMHAIDYHVIPRATFCKPEVGSVGMTELEARNAGLKVGVGRAFFAGFGKALTQGSGEGLVKVVVDMSSGKIIGAGIVGDSAPELIHELALAMHVGATYFDVADMIHAYPTGSEVVKVACSNVQTI